MSLHGLVSAALVSCLMLVLVAAEEAAAPKQHVSPTAAPAPGRTPARPPVNNSTNSTVSTVSNVSTVSSGHKKGFGDMVDGAMIQRALYVLVGITLTGVLYFLIRAVRLKKPAPKKKYGLLSNYDDSVEMDGGESDEDDTLYEARGLRR